MQRRTRTWTIALVLVVALAGVVAWLVAADDGAELPPTFWVRIDEPVHHVYESPGGRLLPGWQVEATLWADVYDPGQYFVRRSPSVLRRIVERFRSIHADRVYLLELLRAESTHSEGPDFRWRELRLVQAGDGPSGR